MGQAEVTEFPAHTKYTRGSFSFCGLLKRYDPRYPFAFTLV
jgi:hypothetical protein